MIKPTHWLVLGLLGSALATVIVQHALKSDGSAAARPVTERTDPSDRTAPKLGRAFLGNSDETADTGDVTMPAGGIDAIAQIWFTRSIRPSIAAGFVASGICRSQTSQL